jgi:hypothetical protein
MRDDLELSRMVTVHGFLNDKPNSGYLFASLIGGILYILPDDNILTVRWVALLHKHSLGIYAVVCDHERRECSCPWCRVFLLQFCCR